MSSWFGGAMLETDGMRISLFSRAFTFTKYQLKRYLLFNAITMPVSTLITLPYNLFVLGYSVYQVKMWLVTGIFFGLVSSLVMAYVSMYASRIVDRHVKR